MRQIFNGVQFKSMLSYFLLAIATIFAYKAVQDIDILFNQIKLFINIISPFIYGFLMAYILNMPCGGIQKLLKRTKSKFVYKRSKALSILITYILLFLMLFLILSLVIPSIYRSIYVFVANYQNYYNRAQELIEFVNNYFDVINIDISMDKIMPSIRDFGMGKLPESINAIFGISSALFSGFLALISSIYILFEKDNFKKYLCKLLEAFFPHTFYQTMIRYSHDLNRNFKQYIYTQTIDGCILGTIVTLELSLLGSPYALVLGIMLGFVNYIPYFGSIFGSIIAIVVVALTQNLSRAGITSIILLITQQIDGNIIQPKLMGGSFSLSPLLVIISITIGGAFYGIFGMLAAIPIVALIKNILDEIIGYCEQSKLVEYKESDL